MYFIFTFQFFSPEKNTEEIMAIKKVLSHWNFELNFTRHCKCCCYIVTIFRKFDGLRLCFLIRL